MSAIPSATTSELALASFAMIEGLYRELVSSGAMTRRTAADALRHAALIAAAMPYGESAAQLIRSLPLAQPSAQH